MTPTRVGEECPHGEVGMLCIHRDDPGLMLRYWNRPAATAAGFEGDWFLTGDLVRRDAEGYLRFVGRDDAQVNVSGYRVSPEEVEAVIRRHPAVRDVAVHARHIEDGLSLLAALVVLRTNVSEEELHQWVHERLATYKCPRIWSVTEELPRNARGKLDRGSLPS